MWNNKFEDMPTEAWQIEMRRKQRMKTHTHNIQASWGDFRMHSRSIIEIPYEKREWDEKNIESNNALLSNINDRHQTTDKGTSGDIK